MKKMLIIFIMIFIPGILVSQDSDFGMQDLVLERISSFRNLKAITPFERSEYLDSIALKKNMELLDINPFPSGVSILREINGLPIITSIAIHKIEYQNVLSQIIFFTPSESKYEDIANYLYLAILRSGQKFILSEEIKNIGISIFREQKGNCVKVSAIIISE